MVRTPLELLVFLMLLLIAVAFVGVESDTHKNKMEKICFALHVHTFSNDGKNASRQTISNTFTLADICAVIVAIVIIISIRVACLRATISQCSLFFSSTFFHSLALALALSRSVSRSVQKYAFLFYSSLV